MNSYGKKNNGSDFFNANRKPIRNHENILIFGKNTTIYNPQKIKGKPYTHRRKNDIEFISTINKTLKRAHIAVNNGERFPNTVIPFKVERGHHTTQKPVALLEWLVRTYTNENAVVLDNTMGSGSTAVACVNTSRNFIGWELDEKYFQTAVKRVDEAKSKIEI